MNAKHTPGEFWAGSDDDAHMVYAGDATTGVIAVADCSRDDGDEQAERETALLFAAAPGLLDALANLLRETSGGTNVCAIEFVIAARAAIAKASPTT